MRILYSEGRPVHGKTMPIPSAALANLSSVVGALYELEMDVRVEDPGKLNRENFELVKRKLYDEYRAKVKYFEVAEINGNYKAVMQLEGSPFSFAALLAALPMLVPLIGLVLVGATVYYIVKEHPLTSVALAFGLMLLLGLIDLPGLLGIKTAEGEE